MREFFHGWRRKVGVVTLVMACVVAGGWLKSCRIQRNGFVEANDFIRLVNDQMASETILSRDGVISWQRIDYPISLAGQDGTAQRDQIFLPTERQPELQFRWQLAGFEREQFRNPDNCRIRRVIVPYWSLVFPLTLLSAYLILWKPRKRA